MKAHAPKSDAGIAGGDGMGGRCVLAVDADGRAALERLGRSGVRGEADRARAVLWSLDGETSAATAARLGVRAEQVRRWRAAFRAGGAAALRSRPRPGRAPRKREAALAVARDVLRGPAADRPVWTLARLAAEVAARTGETISSGHLSVALRKGATAGAGRGTPSRDARTGTRSSARASGCGC
jgi:transposase